MIQMSKVVRSRDDWRRKAIERALKIRELKKNKKRYQKKIAELKTQINAPELAKEEKKNIIPALITPIVGIDQKLKIRTLCIMLVKKAVVSYRSVPRILNLLKTEIPLTLEWIPHFTSVINWCLRLGLGMLKQVRPIKEPWLAIIDYSIDIGTKKVLVVLRVTMDALEQRAKAIQLKDCECLCVKICETVNGKSISMDLDEIFTHTGMPKAILKDCDSRLQKGVRLWSEKSDTTIPVIEDIGHVMASALKAQFEKTSPYKRFTSLSCSAANRLRQTELVFLIPPKLRSKGRFQSISKLGKWSDKMLDVLAIKGRAKKNSRLAKLREVLPGFNQLKPFVKRFANTTIVISQVMEILKKRGLEQTSYEQCRQISKKLPRNSKVKKRLNVWLEQHLKIQKQITSKPLLVSSDIIESLFGNFKHIIERSPQADMNRTTLLIPALCGNLDEITITKALNQAHHSDLESWEQENIPYTVRKKRQAFFRKIESQKVGKI